MTPDIAPQQMLENTASSHLSGGQDRELLPLSQRQTRRTICPPSRFREDMPQPLASLPPQQPNLTEDVDVMLARAIEEPVLPLELHPRSHRLLERACAGSIRRTMPSESSDDTMPSSSPRTIPMKVWH